jgi:hypothetical protein
MAEVDINSLYKNYIENKFHKFSALLIAVFIIILLFIFIHPRIKEDFDYEYLCLFFAVLFVIIYWFIFKFKIPKNKKNKIGIIIAIYAENIKEEIKLKNDFVKRLEKNIKNENYGKIVNFIQLKNHLSEKIKTADDVRKNRNKTKGHFYIWGDVKKRKDGKNGEYKYFLDLSGYVVHKPLNVYLSNELKREFMKVLPKEISFSENFEFSGFKLTSDIVCLAIKYISGLAAFYQVIHILLSSCTRVWKKNLISLILCRYI